MTNADRRLPPKLLTESAAQRALVNFLEARGYETLYCSGAYSNHLSPDPDLGCVDLIYVDGETAERLFANSRAAGPWRHDGASGFAPFTLA